MVKTRTSSGRTRASSSGRSTPTTGRSAPTTNAQRRTRTRALKIPTSPSRSPTTTPCTFGGQVSVTCIALGIPSQRNPNACDCDECIEERLMNAGCGECDCDDCCGESYGAPAFPVISSTLKLAVRCALVPVPEHLTTAQFPLDDHPGVGSHRASCGKPLAIFGFESESNDDASSVQKALCGVFGVDFSPEVRSMIVGSLSSDIALGFTKGVVGATSIIWFARPKDGEVVPIDVTEWFAFPGLKVKELHFARIASQSIKNAFDELSEAVQDVSSSVGVNDGKICRLWTAAKAAFDVSTS